MGANNRVESFLFTMLWVSISFDMEINKTSLPLDGGRVFSLGQVT